MMAEAAFSMMAEAALVDKVSASSADFGSASTGEGIDRQGLCTVITELTNRLQ